MASHKVGVSDVDGSDMDSDDKDCRIESNARQKTFLWGLWILIFLVVLTVVSAALNVAWEILTADAKVFNQSAVFAVIVNAAILGLCYFLFAFVVIPLFRWVYKSKEDPDCCTRSFYRITLIFLSLVYIGTFVAGYVQLFGSGKTFENLSYDDNNNETTSKFNDKFLLIFLSVASSMNFFTALFACVLILTLYFIVSQNPWRRCGSNGHCVISCTLFNLLLIAASVFFLLILEASTFVMESLTTAIRFGGAFLGSLCLIGLAGGLIMTYCRGFSYISAIRLVWFITGGAGCIALASLVSQPGTYIIAYTCGIIGGLCILASCVTGCYCCLNLHQGGRYYYVTRYSFACFRTGSIRPATTEEFNMVSREFTETWAYQKGYCPRVESVFVIINRDLRQKWRAYKHKLEDQTVEIHFHGTRLYCNITRTKKLCKTNHLCGICNISNVGMERQFNRKNVTTFQRFGPGIYLAPNSSKSHDYTTGAHEYRAMLLCYVCPGKKYELDKTEQCLNGPPPGYDSIYGVTGRDLNYSEIVVPDPDAVLPRYIIVYKKDGVKKLT